VSVLSAVNFSVVIAAHNAAATIERTLRSVAAQTLQPKDVLVVDDDSSDQTARLAERSVYPVEIVRVSFHNAAAARNAGVALAKGEWVAFLDSDDEWYPCHLANAAEMLSSGQDVAFLAAANYVHLGDGAVPNPQLGMSESRQHLRDQDFIHLYEKSSWFCNCTAVVQKQRFLAVGGFDAQLRRRHDVELFLRVILGHTWAYCSTFGAKIYLGNASSISGDRVSCELFLLRSFAKLLPDYDSPYFRAILRNRAYCALNTALMIGSKDDLDRAWELGAAYTSGARRAFYGLARRSPVLARYASRAYQQRKKVRPALHC
jgi:glycosyltransferase involved in cell wall biosynthesis